MLAPPLQPAHLEQEQRHERRDQQQLGHWLSQRSSRMRAKTGLHGEHQASSAALGLVMNALAATRSARAAAAARRPR